MTPTEHLLRPPSRKTLLATRVSKKYILKDRLIIFLILILSHFAILAQSSANISNQNQTTTEKTHGPQTLPDNRYGPFHQTIKDTAQKTVSKFGHYISLGVGGGHNNGVGGASALFSYSLAYKSVLFSVTRCGASVPFQGGAENATYYVANYLGLLVGESVRFKHGLVSLSAGIATVRYLDNNSLSANTYAFYTKEGILSFPVELKVFILARNGIGFGVHVSRNFISPNKFSTTFWGVTMVLGSWNKPKIKK